MAGFQQHLDRYAEAGVRVVALSSDDDEDARRMKEAESLEFPVVHGLDVDEMEERLGLYVQREPRRHLQPAQFILTAGGAVGLACYSSGAVGRLRADEALDRAKRLRRQAED